MKTTIEPGVERSDVLASFLIPHVLLDLPSADESAEIRRAKLRRNRAWLQRWLPTYIIRWALIFLASWTVTTLLVDSELPRLFEWMLEFAMLVSGGLALGFTGLYLLSRTAQN